MGLLPKGLALPPFPTPQCGGSEVLGYKADPLVRSPVTLCSLWLPSTYLGAWGCPSRPLSCFLSLSPCHFLPAAMVGDRQEEHQHPCDLWSFFLPLHWGTAWAANGTGCYGANNIPSPIYSLLMPLPHQAAAHLLVTFAPSPPLSSSKSTAQRGPPGMALDIEKTPCGI